MVVRINIPPVAGAAVDFGGPRALATAKSLEFPLPL